MRPGGIGNAQTGTQIVRILNAIEHQQQRRLGQRVEHVVELEDALHAVTLATTP